MCIHRLKSLLVIASILLLTSGQLFLGESALAQSVSWLDNAVSGQQCPLSPVNVPAAMLAGSASALRKQITISEQTLHIMGTANPDHILVSAGALTGYVKVTWNGKQLGDFGPVQRIVMRGGGGDDVLVLKANVTIPGVLDGGAGDDCVQGGAGGDVLLGGDGNDVVIAGTGRPALDGGSGANRVVIPNHMGTLWYAPSADSKMLSTLSQIYDLQPLSQASSQSQNGLPSPIILGADDLQDEQLGSLLQASRTAGQSVVLTNATEADSEQLRLMLGHPNSTKLSKDKEDRQEEGVEGETSSMFFFRTAPRAETNGSDYRAGIFKNVPNSLDDVTIERLSQVYSATALLSEDPGDSSSSDLTKLADSYTNSSVNQGANGDTIQVVDTVYGARSFLNQEDFFYVLQEVDYQNGAEANSVVDTTTSYIYPNSANPTGVLQPSPGSTSCQHSTTSSLSYTISGSVGWNQTQGVNASVGGSVTVTHSSTITCPNTLITDMTNPSTGQTQWTYQISNPPAGNLATFINQWIWEVPFGDYQPTQESLVYNSNAVQQYNVALTTDFQAMIPLPFGDTKTLQQPQVLNTNPTCVNAGNTFTIQGTGLYPALVSSVLIGGQTLPTSAYTATSDTSITAVAPELSGDELAVVVQTAEGESNSNVTMEISVIGLCSY
jgi:RTX calcium-binding nonapeptide repeat (4 copies)